MHIPIVGQTFEIDGYKPIQCTANANNDAKSFAKVNNISFSEAKYILETFYGNARLAATSISPDEDDELATEIKITGYKTIQTTGDPEEDIAIFAKANNISRAQAKAVLEGTTNSNSSTQVANNSANTNSPEMKAARFRMLSQYANRLGKNSLQGLGFSGVEKKELCCPWTLDSVMEEKKSEGNAFVFRNPLGVTYSNGTYTTGGGESRKQLLDSISEAERIDILNNAESQEYKNAYSVVEKLYLSGASRDEAGEFIAEICGKKINYDSATGTLVFSNIFADVLGYAELANQFMALFGGKADVEDRAKIKGTSSMFNQAIEMGATHYSSIIAQADSNQATTSLTDETKIATASAKMVAVYADIWMVGIGDLGFSSARINNGKYTNGQGSTRMQELNSLSTAEKVSILSNPISDENKEAYSALEKMYIAGMTRDDAGKFIEDLCSRHIIYDSSTGTLKFKANCPCGGPCGYQYGELANQFMALFGGKIEYNKNGQNNTLAEAIAKGKKLYGD